MKIAVSIPDDVFRDAERTAKRLGWSRSALYAAALAEFLERQGDDPVTVALDQLADELRAESTPTPGRSLIESGSWQW